MTDAQAPLIWPLVLYTVLVVLLAAAMIFVPWLLGQRHKQRATGTPYEGGMIPTGSARARVPAEYYLMAMFFVVFDLEAVFIYTWAVSARETGWAAYGQISIFIGVLLAALGYLWGIGALEWGTSAQHLGRAAPDGDQHHV
ncbi:MAG: NADH-quinone oxidoreductase subunit A [Armatimonadia bacterium]